MIYITFLALNAVLAIVLIVLILLNRGSGANAGAAFGGGASATVFGARGAASFLTRLISILSIVFLSIHWCWLLLPTENLLVAMY